MKHFILTLQHINYETNLCFWVAVSSHAQGPFELHQHLRTLRYRRVAGVSIIKGRSISVCTFPAGISICHLLRSRLESRQVNRLSSGDKPAKKGWSIASANVIRWAGSNSNICLIRLKSWACSEESCSMYVWEKQTSRLLRKETGSYIAMRKGAVFYIGCKT